MAHNIHRDNHAWLRFVMFDIMVACFLLIGIGLGMWRGFFSSLLLMIATYVPMMGFILYFDQISHFVKLTIANTSDGITASIGALGAFAGIISVIGFFGGIILGTRILLKIIEIEKPDWPMRIAGGFSGFVSQSLIATLTFFFFYSALPTNTAQFVKGSYWLKLMRPIHLATYPYYQSAFKARTQAFSMAIAKDGFGASLIGGISLNNVNEGLGFDKPSLSAALQDIQQLANSIDIDGLTQMLEEVDQENLNPADIDRMIQEEQAKRRALIDQQLQ